MKIIIFLLLLLPLSVNASSIPYGEGTLFNTIGVNYISGDFPITPLDNSCSGDYCQIGWATSWTGTIYDEILDETQTFFYSTSLYDYWEFNFIEKSATVTFDWWYKNADPDQLIDINGVIYSGLANNSGSSTFTMQKNDSFSAAIVLNAFVPETELFWKVTFSNIQSFSDAVPPISEIPIPAPLLLFSSVIIPLVSRRLLKNPIS